MITRRRIVDHLRRRKPDERLRKSSESADTSTGTDTIHRLPDPASVKFETFWAEEWQKNLVDVAIERVKSKSVRSSTRSSTSTY